GWSPDGGLFHLCRESPREAPAYQSTPSQPPPVQGEGAKRGVRWIALRGLLRPVQRILDVGDFVQDHVLQLPIHFLDFADIDGLHSIAGYRIDRDRAARAVPDPALGGIDQRIPAGIATGYHQRLEEQVHAVIAADRELVRFAAVIGGGI